MKKRLLSTLLALCMVLALLPRTARAAVVASGSCGANGDNVTWSLGSGGTLTISGTGKMRNYKYIVGDHGGSIDSPWYGNRLTVTTVVIKDGVTSIGDYAFGGCENLTNITIPESVTSIGDIAFLDCDQVSSVIIPANVASIGDNAFSYCLNLTTISVDVKNSVYASVNGVLFNKKMDELIQYPIGKAGVSYVIPSGVAFIGNRAFNYCKQLTSVTFPASVTSIGEYSFICCNNLTDVTLPNSVTSIGHRAFALCDRLTNVTIPVSVTSIGKSAFNECSRLSNIYYHGTKTQWEQIDVDNTDNGNNTLFNATIHYSSTGSEVSPISGTCGDNLTWTLRDGILTISGTGDMFNYASFGTPWYNIRYDIEQIILNEGITNIGSCAFFNCVSLVGEVTIPDGITSIGNWAFKFCGGLTSVTILNSITYIGEEAFFDCESLTDVYYGGTKEQWDAVSIGNYNMPLTSATIHYGTDSDDVSAYYIEAMHFGDLVINSSGTATAYYCVKDKDGNPLSGKTLQYELTGKDGVTTVKTDSNGLFGVTTPRLTKSASFWATIAPVDSSIEIYNEDQFFDVEVKELSYSQEWEGVYNGGVSLGVDAGVKAEAGPVELSAILAGISGSIDLSKSVSIEDEYDNGTRTLTLNCTNKGGDSLKLKSGLSGKLKILKAELGPGIGLSGKATLSQQAGAGLTIENYDPYNKEQLRQIGLYTVVPFVYTSSLFYNRIFEKISGGICNKESSEIGLGLAGNADTGKIDLTIANIKGTIDSTGTYASVWNWKDSYDYTDCSGSGIGGGDSNNPKFTTSKSLKISAGGGIGSSLGTADIDISKSREADKKVEISVTGEIGNYAYGLNRSNSKEISVMRPSNSSDFDSISYKVYDGNEENYCYNSMVKDTYATVTYEGEYAKNIFANDPDLVRWSRGKNPFINIQDTIDNMFLSNGIASVKVTTKLKEAQDYSLPIGVSIGVSVGINCGISGEHSFSWENANGALYNSTVYTTTVSDIDRTQIEPSLGGLDDLLLEAAHAVFTDIMQHMIIKSGLVSVGVSSDSLKVTGDNENWYVVISTVEPETSMNGRSIEQNESYATIALLSEDDLTVFASVGVPYEVATYTDDNKTILVTDEELGNDPLTLTFQYTDKMLESASADKYNDVMLLRYDAENDVYLCIKDAVQDKENMTVTAKMTKNGEYILAVNSIAEEPPVPATYTITFDANGGTGTMPDDTATENIPFALPACTFTAPAGKEFKAWSIDGKEYAPGAAYTFVADTTVAAVWQDAAPAPEHSHTWETVWHYDETHHWHECSTRECLITENSSKSEYGEHTWDKENGTVCSTCEYQRAVDPPRPTEEEETYYISIPSIMNGEIIPNTRYASPGERVTLTAHPDKGYNLDTLTVTDIRGRTLVLRELSGNSYSFAMPDNRVTVNASFAKIENNTSSASTPAEDEPFMGLGTPGISGIVLNPAPMPFTDVRSGDWYYDNVDYVWKHYLMSGVSDTEFSPNATTTRAMIWTVLARMKNVRTEVNPGSNWYERGMIWAMEQGITDGSNPMGDITREQLATMLWRNAGSPGATADLSRFSDSGSVSDYAKSAVNWAVANGILNGSDGKLNLKGTATRAQVAAMVMRYGERVGA